MRENCAAWEVLYLLGVIGDTKVNMKVGKPNTPELMRKELRTLALFVELYCRGHHEERNPFILKGFDVDEVVGKQVEVCGECAKLLSHAWMKRKICPMDPKPACKNCPSHCYQTTYRTRMQEVMRYSGKQMVLRGRLDYLLKLL